MDEVLKAMIRELCGVMNGVDERIKEGVLQLFGQVEWREWKMIRGFPGIWRMDKVPNTQITEFCGVTKGVDKGIDEHVL